MSELSHNLSPEEEGLLDLVYGDAGADEEAILRCLREAGLEQELQSLRELRELYASMPEDEPPLGVSTRLLVLAAEHAQSPAGQESEFWRRARLFFVQWWAQPAVMAAAGILLIAGVGSSLYLRGDLRSVQPSPNLEAAAAKYDVDSKTAPVADPLVPATGSPAEDSPSDNELAELANGYVDGRDADKAETNPKGVKDTVAKSPQKASRRSGLEKKKRRKSRKQIATTKMKRNKRMSRAAKKTVRRPLGRASADSEGAYAPPPVAKQEAEREEVAMADAAKPIYSAKATAAYKQALRALGRGECATAQKIRAKIKRLDRTFYRNVVVKDRRFRNCQTVPPTSNALK